MTPSGNPSETILEDTTVVAFLKLKNHAVISFTTLEEPQKVKFKIGGDPQQIELDIVSFYGNATVGVLDFCRCLKEIKSAMYNLKKVGRK
jgi:hypothetical protein